MLLSKEFSQIIYFIPLDSLLMLNRLFSTPATHLNDEKNPFMQVQEVLVPRPKSVCSRAGIDTPVFPLLQAGPVSTQPANKIVELMLQVLQWGSSWSCAKVLD